MLYLLTTLHVLICFFLIIVVLLQSGKAADLAGAFGGMGSQTAFGPRGAATMLSKATTIAAALFMVLSVWLGIEQGRYIGTGATGAGSSVVERTGVGGEAPAPAAPGTAPVVPAPAVTQEPASQPAAPAAPAETPPPPQQ